MSAEGGPTIYARLMDARLDEPHRELRDAVEGFLRGDGLDALTKHFEEQLKRAYIAGVSDGFVQGVAAPVTGGWEA